MKKLLFLFLLPLFSAAQSNTAKAEVPRFVISGKITGLADSTFIFIAHPSDPSKVLATAYSKKGAFTLFGDVENPDLYRISFIGHPQTVDIFLSKATHTLTGNVKNLDKVKIAGATVQNDYQTYINRFTPVKKKLDSLAAAINSTPPSPRRDSAIRIFEENKGKVLSLVSNFVKEKPASPVSSYILYVTSPVSTNIEQLEQQLNSLTPAARNTIYANEVQKIVSASRIGMEGTMAVDFTQNDTANNPVTLSSFKGKYVLVDFWASWCRPCRMENPAVVAAYNQYKNKNFTVLGVSLDQSRPNWLQAIEADKLTWTHVSDLKYWNNEVAQLYHIQGIPANMLIDPSGKIIARNLRGEQLHEVLGKILK